MRRVKAVLLDVNGTVFPVSSAGKAFAELGLKPDLVQLWFAEVLRDAFAAQLAGVFAPFSDFAEHRLQHFLETAGKGGGRAGEGVGRVLAAWGDAEPFPDVGPGLQAIQHGGIKVTALTNGSTVLATKVLSRAGVDRSARLPLFDINEPKAWKPSKEAYRFVADALLLAPEEIMVAAAHPWDCHGALQAGLQACYVRRPNGAEPYPSFLDQPQLTVASFEELARALVPAQGA